MTDPAVRQVIGACPLDCPDACSWIVTVTDGKATRLRGNPDHPFTRGGLCKKVNPWLEYAADPSRITRPMRRVGAKGEGRFEPISWDDAISEIAERFETIIEEHGAEAIWPFSGTGNVGWIQGAGSAGTRLFNAMGASSNRITICSISGHAGLSYSLGTAASLDPEEFVHAGVVLIWGSNTLVANQHFWPVIEEAKANGATVVVIDPVGTRTAQRAAVHIAPRPGTDSALALGLCRQLIEIGAADLDFLAEQTVGFDEFVTSIDEWTLQRTAEECDLDEAEIVDLVELIASRGPLAIKLGQGMQRQAFGGQAARVVSCLPAVVGSYGQLGGGLTYSTSGPYNINWYKGTRPDLAPTPVRALANTNLGNHLTALDDPPIKALVVYGANPMVSNAQTQLIRQGLERDDLFTVAIELYPTETVAYADIVLPSTMQHEQYEMNESFAHLYLNWNEPAVEPPGECLPHTEIFRRLATAMGITDPAVHASDFEIAADLLDTDAYRDAGITVERLRDEGFVRLPDTSPYRPLAKGFPTISGKFQFASPRAEEDGHGRLPNYRAPGELAREPSEYNLIAHGSDGHLNSMFVGTERVQARVGAPPVVIHPDDAERDGLVSGSEVIVGNSRGSFEAILMVGTTARPGLAATTKGWWGQGVNATILERNSDMARGAIFHDNVVTIVAKHISSSVPSAQST